MIDIDDLLGCPYLIHGRSQAGFDCSGLVIEVERRLGRELKDLYTEYTEKNSEQTLNENSATFIKNMNLIKTDVHKLGDLVLFFNNKGESVHIGVCLNGDDFIHCDKRGVSVDRLTDYFRKKREFYKWQE